MITLIDTMKASDSFNVLSRSMSFRDKARRELGMNGDFLGTEICIRKEPAVSPPVGG